MSKKKIIGCLLFMACFLSFSMIWLGFFPHWSIATQSVIRLHNSSELSKVSIPLPNQTVGRDLNKVIDNNAEPLTTVQESNTTGKAPKTTETSPNSALPDHVEYPEESPVPPFDESKRSTEERLSESEQNLTQSKENPTQSEGNLSKPEESQFSPSIKQPIESEAKPKVIISSIQKEDLSPTPLPGLPGTPIHPYYGEDGNPPTAPGLAMRQRKFQLENEKMAYLTFDDGPYPSTTPRILAILEEEKVQATFFNIGQQMLLYPDLLKAEYEQGHAIGNHTFSHNMTEVYKGPQYFLADVKKAEEIIYNTIGIRPQIVRAPGGTVGHFNIKYFNAMDAEGYLMEDWNVDPGDTSAHLVTAKQLMQQVEQQVQGKTRVVVLLHDLVGKDTTIEALPGIIESLKKQGFSFGVLGPDVLPIVFSAGLRG